MTVRWSDHAACVVREISRQRARQGRIASESWLTALAAAMRALGRFPRSGRVVRGVAVVEHREIRVQEYRVIYRVEEGAVHVREVVHARQDWDPNRLALLP